MKSPQDTNSNSPSLQIPGESADAVAAHYRQAYPRLVSIAAGVLGGREDAEDVVQQAAGIAIEKGQQFDTPAGFVRWLAGVVRHCALNHRRKRLGRRTYAADPHEMSHVGASNSLATGELTIHPQSGELMPGQDAFDDEVLQALRSLGDEARCCLLLRTIQQLTYAEIADLMHIPEGTAMSHVHRSRKALRIRLASHELARKPPTEPNT